MILDALRYLGDLAVTAATPRKLDSGDPRLMVYTIGGGVEKIPTEPTPRNHAVFCLGDLVNIANRFADAASKPVVWYDEAAVVLVIDDDGHRLEKVTLGLNRSDVFTLLAEITQATPRPKYDQKAFVRLLRIDLAGTLDPVVLLDKVRKIRFENGQSVELASTRQRESMGRTITSQATCAGGDLPEEVTLQVRVYKTLGLRESYPLRCSVEVDPAEGSFRLIPLPDEIERVEQMAMTTVLGCLDDGLNEAIPRYYGAP